MQSPQGRVHNQQLGLHERSGTPQQGQLQEQTTTFSNHFLLTDYLLNIADSTAMSTIHFSEPKCLIQWSYSLVATLLYTTGQAIRQEKNTKKGLRVVKLGDQHVT